MSALNFKERFAGMVERGEKRQTIRAKRKRPIVIGETLHLFTGQRTKACRRLGTGRCTRVREVVIDRGSLILDGRLVSFRTRYAIADMDGFCRWEDFTAFFAKRGLPFEGVLIEWELEPSRAKQPMR